MPIPITKKAKIGFLSANLRSLATKGGNGQEQYPSLPRLSSRSRFRSRTFTIPRYGKSQRPQRSQPAGAAVSSHEEQIATTQRPSTDNRRITTPKTWDISAFALLRRIALAVGRNPFAICVAIRNPRNARRARLRLRRSCGLRASHKRGGCCDTDRKAGEHHGR